MNLTQLQQQVRNDDARFKVLICGRRWGKTVFSISQLLEHASKPNQKYGMSHPLIDKQNKLFGHN